MVNCLPLQARSSFNDAFNFFLCTVEVTLPKAGRVSL